MVDGLRAAHAAYHEARPGEDSSAGAIALAYQWLTAGRVGDGMALMELNASTFSSDPNAQFHLGEAFRYAGQNERAAEQYRRVLELDPEHGNAAARLSQVTGR
jgi:Tfp pilus assembly protein PilF